MIANPIDNRVRIRRIARVSLTMRLVLLAVAILTTISWVVPALSSSDVQFKVWPLQITWTLWSQWPSLHEAVAEIGWSPFVVFVVPRVLVFLAVVYQVLRLFGLYQAGSIFTMQHVLCLRRIGCLLVFWGAFLLFYPALVLMLATLFAEGYAGYWFSANWDPLFYLVGGMGLLVMAWVMQEGLEIQADQELTI